ncbi:hypothetical protein CAEBREN_02331 [Caenorhabditis brenneri]|uniref:HMG box domain-containing protein n=1 Tax=Caenorhabditis brenneri TaxID=135651 RepID=G0N7U3_CAEBE|nr:hypothetical protein CAEBREN_02331 [Caenorhabditis brenneri]
MASRRTQNKWDFKRDDGFKKTKEEKEMEEYMKTTKNKDRKVLERMLSKTVANKPKNQDRQAWKQLESIGEDGPDNALNTSNTHQFYRDGFPQNISSALANFDMVFKSTPQGPSTQALKKIPAARAKHEQTQRFYLFFNTMARCVEQYIGDRSVPYIINQCWANLKNTYKEEFRTKSMELHLAFREEIPEIDVQSVDYDPYFMSPVITTSSLRVPKHPGSPFTYFRKVMTQEIKLNHPKMKTAQVSRQVQQRWNTLSVDERNRNKEAFQQAVAAYKQEMDKAPERQKALDNLKTRMQIELEPFIKFCHGIVQRFKQSNPAYETFTTPQEKYRTLLAPTKRPLHDPVRRNTEETLRFNPELMKNPVVAQFMSYEANDGEEPDMDLFEDHDPVEKTNGNTLKTKPEPGKEPNAARLVNHEADDCEDSDMDTLREFFPDYSMNELPKHADDFVGNDSTPAKKMRYQDVEGVAFRTIGAEIPSKTSYYQSPTEHSPTETQLHGNEFYSTWDGWNGDPGYETNGFEANHVEFYSQQEQFDHNFVETEDFGQVSEMPINTQSSVSNKFGLNHNTALRRFCTLELINLDGEIRNSFSDEMLCTYLCNRWEETSKGRKVEFELIGTNNMGNTSQFLDGHPNSPFGKFCAHAIKKLGLDSIQPDELRSLLENLWNLDSEENKSQYYITDDQRTLNSLQFSPVSRIMHVFEDHDVVDVKKKKKTKRNQKQESPSQLDPAVLNPADISLY